MPTNSDLRRRLFRHEKPGESQAFVLLVILMVITALGVGYLLVTGTFKLDGRSIKDTLLTAEQSNTARYLVGYHAYSQGDLQTAEENFSLVLPVYGQDPHFQRIYYEIILHTKGLAAALLMINSQSDNPSKITGYLPFIVQAVGDKNYDRALELMKAMQGEEQGEVLLLPFLASWCKAAKGNWHEAIASLEKMQAGSVAPLVQFHLGMMYELAGETNKAQTKMGQAVEAYLYSYDSYSVAANFFARHQNAEKAKLLYKHYRQLYPYEDYFARELAAREAIANLLGEMAAGFLQNRLPNPALIYIELAEYMQPNAAQWQFLKGRIYDASEQYSAAIAQYSLLEEESDFFVQAQINSAAAQYKLGNKDSAVQAMLTLEKQHPKQLDVGLAMADIYLQESKFTEAIAVYSKLISDNNPSSHHEWPLYFLRGTAYDRAGNWDQAEADLLKAMDLNAEQVDVLNYLGYSWLTRGKNMKRAANLIFTAFRQRPLDAAIMDSMAWVYYHTHQSDEARQLLEKSRSMQSDDPIIHEHLGDVYWQMRHYTEAEFEWQHAVELSTITSDKARLNKKLSDGLSDHVPYIDDSIISAATSSGEEHPVAKGF